MNKLDTLIPAYYQNKERMEDYKKIVDNQNKEIKELLDNDSYTVGEYKATVSTQTRVTMDEKKLLNVVESSCYLNKDSGNYNIMLENYPGLIKTIKVVDMDVLEDVIYNNLLSEDTLKRLGDCKSEKEVKTLRVTHK